MSGNAEEQNQNKETAKALSALAKIINQFGPDSPEAESYVQEHAKDPEFVRLGTLSQTLSQTLSRALNPRWQEG